MVNGQEKGAQYINKAIMSDSKNSVVDFKKALGDRYLSYALSTIMSRSLPDVRDGLKPVHRRLIYAMKQLKLLPTQSFKKSARVVGDVMGKFHPHGDAPIYGALVRLAQDFSMRYPLIEGQGNFGNIDGDNPAAMRYTEARLTDLALYLMEGMDQNAIDFRETYDGDDQEPEVFPSAFPNLLANGSTGIAVGMATSIPPHNLEELIHALSYLIKKPAAETKDLFDYFKGPDLPTGGILTENHDILLKAYETGKGSFRVRARWETEPLKGGNYQVVITEIPYMVEKAKLIEKIAILISDRKLTLINSIQDESAEDLRIVIEPRSKSVDPEQLMESLFRQSDMESRVSLNMTVLDKTKTPRVMSLKEVLAAFLDHQKEVLIRAKNHRLDQINHRLELLEGYLIVYLNIDEVIRIIRDEDDAKGVLQKTFNLSDIQVEAILNMRLRSLRKLQEIEIRQEHDNLSLEKGELKALLSDEKKQWKVIDKNLKELSKKFGQKTEIGRRRTSISEAPKSVVISLASAIEKEDITIVLSKMEWIRSLKGHDNEATDIKYKEGDEESFILKGSTVDSLIIATQKGRFYTIPCDRLPKGRGFGEALRLLIDMESDDFILNTHLLSPESEAMFLIASSSGRGFTVKGQDLLSQTKSGRQVLTLADDESAKACHAITGDHLCVIGTNRKLLIFPVSELPTLSKGKGVILQKYKEATLSDLKIINLEDGLPYKRHGTIKTQKDLRPWTGKRAQTGRLAPIGFPRSNLFS